MAELYEAEEDIIETLPDGRQVQVALKGQRIPMAEAERLGLLKKSAKPAPSENKSAAPSETKATKKGGK